MKKLNIFFIDSHRVLHASFNVAKKALWFLARDTFLFTLILVLLTIVFGEFLFYNYVLLVEIKKPNTLIAITSFKKDTFESVVRELERRESIFNTPFQANHQDPFQ